MDHRYLLSKVLTVLIINKNKQENAIIVDSKYEISAKLGMCSKAISGHWNYMGVVSRLLIASSGCRLMERHYVHPFRFPFQVLYHVKTLQ